MEVVSALIVVSDITTRINPHKDPDPPTGGQDDPISIYMLDTEFSESFKDTIKENLQLF
ncbi:MAG: hypothetical protein JJ958_13765 [Balneola sp.]|jgi:hypothetical protein|nr:hypothetical protein [Balneola sp.]